MMQKVTSIKKTAIAVLSSCLLLGSLQSFAQKSVYDVIPGSGPKKSTTKSAPGVINGTDKKREGVYYERRRRLPPGQAKKVYGGYARDYAPGHYKKGKHHKGKKHWSHNRRHKGHHHDD